MENIQNVILPSAGLLEINPEVTIRGMKGKEISTLYSSLTEASIEAIIKAVVQPEINIECLCDEDKKYILHKTRVLTFGNITYQTLRCPFCGNIHEYTVDYSTFNVSNLSSEYINKKITLANGDIIEPRVPVKKDWAAINRYKEKANLASDYAFILLQIARIDTLNDKRKAIHELLDYLENLPGVELVKLAEALDTKFGLDTSFSIDCASCNTTFTGGLGLTADLFR